jgi:hypothetical protein
MEIRRVICLTNAIVISSSREGVHNVRYRRDIKARGHFPFRAGRAAMSVPGNSFPGTDRCGQGTMDDAVETSVECVRDHLRRPTPGSRELLMKPPEPPLMPMSRTTRMHPARRCSSWTRQAGEAQIKVHGTGLTPVRPATAAHRRSVDKLDSTRPNATCRDAVPHDRRWQVDRGARDPTPGVFFPGSRLNLPPRDGAAGVPPRP